MTCKWGQKGAAAAATHLWTNMWRYPVGIRILRWNSIVNSNNLIKLALISTIRWHTDTHTCTDTLTRGHWYTPLTSNYLNFNSFNWNWVKRRQVNAAEAQRELMQTGTKPRLLQDHPHQPRLFFARLSGVGGGHVFIAPSPYHFSPTEVGRGGVTQVKLELIYRFNLVKLKLKSKSLQWNRGRYSGISGLLRDDSSTLDLIFSNFSHSVVVSCQLH